MDKKEIEHRIKKYELVRECAEENLNELNIQLAEAENPKLRHGDWWLTRGDKGDVRIFMKEYNGKGRDCVALRGILITNIGSEYEGQPILGNVFDLMEEWSEPFKEYGADKYATGINIRDDGAIRIYACTGQDCKKENCSCVLFLNEAKEFHNALGHAIAELKRKENKNE